MREPETSLPLHLRGEPKIQDAFLDDAHRCLDTGIADGVLTTGFQAGNILLVGRKRSGHWSTPPVTSLLQPINHSSVSSAGNEVLRKHESRVWLPVDSQLRGRRTKGVQGFRATDAARLLVDTGHQTVNQYLEKDRARSENHLSIERTRVESLKNQIRSMAPNPFGWLWPHSALTA